MMKRNLVITWLVLTAGVGLFLVIGWFVLPTGLPFWRMAKGLTCDIALMSPAIRYLRNNPRKAIR